MRVEQAKKDLSLIAKEHHVPCISSATESYIVQYLMENKPKHCLEIGSAIGYSTLTIASTIQAWKGSLISFEISHPSYMTALYMLRQTSLFNTNVYHLDIRQAPLQQIICHPLDFIFIDGAKAEYAEYLSYLLPYCGSNTTIICDDILMYADKISPLYQVIQDNRLSYQERSLDDGDGILVITFPSSQ